MISHTFRSGKQVSYRYDAFGNIVEKQETSEDGNQSGNYYRYEYSKDGLLTSAVGGGITQY